MKFLAILPVLALAACWGGSSGNRSAGTGDSSAADEADAPLHAFPLMSVPVVYENNAAEAREYSLEHYWDGFFSKGGGTDSKSILGVADADVEQALANYIGALAAVKSLATPDSLAPLRQAQKSVRTLFGKLENHQKADTSSLTYLRFTEMVSRYLFDPNSPVRDEDLYLPFVEAMERSSCTSDDMRAAYSYEARQCRTNQYGQKVPDFRYSTASGSKGSLYGVKADYTMLFFSNPGCTACKDIIDQVLSRPYVERYIKEGRLAVVNIYIDEEISKWRDYLHNYPSYWINGYDYTFQLRDSGKYDIRAIPSLYLLDSSKRVLFKDAPTENVLSFLDTI
ncbi:MAG: DUF5106 domain-containing protein [Bacteroidales bacterium]|nr:DUF5106 domain-containing protein [Bacteroidales bacterium]